MVKRGQVTIFVIVALVLIAGVGLGAYFLGRQTTAAESPGVKEVSNFVEDCLKKTSFDAVMVIGEQGGYYELPEKFNNFSLYPKPYYIYETREIVPTKATVESQIAKYIQNNLDGCLNNFTELKKEGYSIRKGSNKASVTLIRDEVDIGLTTRIIITKNESTSEIQDFSAVVAPVRLMTLLNISRSIADSESKDPRLMCVTCINSIVGNENLSVSIIGTDNKNDYIFVLNDERSNFSNFSYSYSFAAKYTFPECNSVGGCLDAVQQ